VGKTGFARAAHTLFTPKSLRLFGAPSDFMQFRVYEEPHKIGKLSENQKFLHQKPAENSAGF
jgi:hypothetical protein